jgi:2-polyprenyl-3-methyl-5-hydroxy-6-metoxy-1,4-benzoquinol methylase
LQIAGSTSDSATAKSRAERGVVDCDKRPKSTGRVVRKQQFLVAVIFDVAEHVRRPLTVMRIVFEIEST